MVRSKAWIPLLSATRKTAYERGGYVGLDSIILAIAREYSAIVWTQDEHFKDLEGVQYIEKVV